MTHFNKTLRSAVAMRTQPAQPLVYIIQSAIRPTASQNDTLPAKSTGCNNNPLIPPDCLQQPGGSDRL